MEETDQFNQMLRQKLSNHQEVVRPEIWAAVSSAIATPVLVTTGISILSKTFIGIGIAATVLVSAYLLYSSDDKVVKVPTQEKKKAKEVPSNPTNDNTLVPIETKKNAIPLVVQENNDILSSEDVVYKKNDPQIIPFESVQLPNTDPLQDLGEITTPEVVINQKELVVPPKATNEPNILPEKEELIEVVLSNVFTPNGDGINDFLSIVSEGLSDFSVVVLNGSNEVVFKSSDPNFNWDGKTPNGADAPEGNYLYFFTAKSPTGKILQQSSSLFIQR